MYFFEALQYPFNSKSWLSKAIIGAVLLFIPILGSLVIGGYVLRLVREILDGNMELPEFDFGADFMRGLTAFLFSLVYQIPVFILSFILGLVFGRNGSLIASLIGGIFGLVVGLVLMVGYVRYAISEDSGVFMQFSRNIGILQENIGTLISYFINALLYGLVAGILLMIGYMLCFLPGLILTPMVVFGGAYMIARLAQDLGITAYGEKAKNVG